MAGRRGEKRRWRASAPRASFFRRRIFRAKRHGVRSEVPLWAGNPERAFFLAPAISGVYLWERGIFPFRVKLSIKSDYAARAVLWLAQHHQEDAARTVEEMASAQGIPPNYLVQILIELKSAQIVKSQRGKEGGYLLARPPAKITFGDVLRSIHGEIFDSPALNNPSNPPELRQAWQRLRRAVNQTADAITFQQLLDESLEKGKMYYI